LKKKKVSSCPRKSKDHHPNSFWKNNKKSKKSKSPKIPKSII